MKQSGVMAVKKKIIIIIIIIINECGRFACQAYIESATALSDYNYNNTEYTFCPGPPTTHQLKGKLDFTISLREN